MWGQIAMRRVGNASGWPQHFQMRSPSERRAQPWPLPKHVWVPSVISFAFFVALLPIGAVAQEAPAPAHVQQEASPSTGAQTIDAIAARIDTDVITESEVRELAGFQMLVDGASKSRDEIIRELTDQWIVQGEAETARFPHPSDQDIDNAYAGLVKQFPSQQAFDQRCTQAGLTQDAVRRQLAKQLYLSRFLDFRFRPAAEVSDADVQKYYEDEFAPQLKAKNEPVPPLEQVQSTIREVLIQRDITDRANQWLDDTRARLEVDMLSASGGAQ
jgi:hypothetical protein